MELSEHLKNISPLGGKARWKNVSKKKRSEAMRKVFECKMLKLGKVKVGNKWLSKETLGSY